MNRTWVFPYYTQKELSGLKRRKETAIDFIATPKRKMSKIQSSTTTNQSSLGWAIKLKIIENNKII